MTSPIQHITSHMIWLQWTEYQVLQIALVSGLSFLSCTEQFARVQHQSNNDP